MANDLADLYVVGRVHTVSQEGARPVKVWLQKLNDVEHDLAIKKAMAAQARALSVIRDEDSDEYLQVVQSVDDMELDEIVTRVVEPKRARVIQAEDAKLAATEEWEKDGYLEGLRRSWREGIELEWLQQFPDVEPEVQRVLDELTRFNAMVSENVELELAHEREEAGRRPESELRDDVVKVQVKTVGVAAFMQEFSRCRVWLGVRECTHSTHDRPRSHRKRYFDSRADVDVLQKKTFEELSDAIENLTVDTTEGKDSEETPPSSSSSESPEQPEAEVSSGLVAASQ